MSLSDLASIGSFISGIAVVTTLIVLVVQTRQSIRNRRSLIAQGMFARTSELLLKLSEPYWSDIAAHVDLNDSSLSSSELQAITRVWHAFFAGLADSFQQHQTGTLDRTNWHAAEIGLRQMASFPSVRVSWKMVRMLADDSFRDFVDGIMREVRVVPPPADYARAWRAMMTEELASA